MKNILFVALLAGVSAVEAAPLSSPSASPLTVKQSAQDQAPMSKAELKRRRKLRKQNGPQVYKGTVAEQNRIITDAAGSEKEDGDDASKVRKSKKN